MTKTFTHKIGSVAVNKQNRYRFHVACGGKHALIEITKASMSYEDAFKKALRLWKVE